MTANDYSGGKYKTYTNSYLSGTGYASLYIVNRLLTSTVTDGTSTVRLVSNSYDNAAGCTAPRIGGGAWQPVVMGSPQDQWVEAQVREHDPAYGSSFAYLGNRTVSNSIGHARCMSYNAGGVMLWAYDNGVETTSNYSQSPNMAVPTAMTANTGLTSTMNWNSFLGLTSESGPNGETASTLYDSYARPSSSTSPTGVTTTYAYDTSARTATATTNGRWTRTTVDGFGRTIQVEQGNGPTTSAPVSITETTYDACGCSPVGKTKAVSMPRASGATAVGTVYSYDALGRTTSITMPDGSARQYAYAANTVQVTDEAGKAWKKYWMDGFGNLSQVQEPDPANPGSATYNTYYTYDVLGHLTGVNMPRPTGTQTRTFNYGNPPGAYLLSATNPENGTVTYTYTWFGKVATKTDAKNQQVQYTYDDYQRLTQISYFTQYTYSPPCNPCTVWQEDTSARVTISYDTNADDSSYSQYARGRMTERTYTVNGRTFIDMYSYTQAGQVAGKRLRVKQTFQEPSPYPPQTVWADLNATWSYDNEGRMTSVTYPQTGGGGGQTYNYAYDANGRLNTMQFSGGGGIITGATYGPAGELLSMSGVVSESRAYNSRLQLTSLNH